MILFDEEDMKRMEMGEDIVNTDIQEGGEENALEEQISILTSSNEK